MKSEYNLLDEPWIRVMGLDGSYSKVGLKEAIVNAHQFRIISGESSGQDLAVMRLILAVIYAVYAGDEVYRKMEESETVDLWKTLWAEGRFDKNKVESYLEKYRERFYLFGDVPFYQCSEIKGSGFSVYKLVGDISESNNKVRLFKSAGFDSIEYDEAARWLIHLNCFDDLSAKPKTKGAPSPGVGWLGKIGAVYAQGRSLFETLMLNFVLTDEKGAVYDIEGRPVWECEPSSAERVEIAKPRNQMKLFTVQSRRILLKREGTRVTGYSLLGGEFFDKKNVAAETMTMWHVDKNKVDRVPVRHTVGRALWRDFGVLVGIGGPESVGVVRWVSVLRHHRAYPLAASVFRSTGLHYGDKDFFVDGNVENDLVFNPEIISPAYEVWSTRIAKTVDVTDESVVLFGKLVWQVLVSLGYDSEQDKQMLIDRSFENKERLYSAIDLPFRNWLSELDPESDDLDEKIAEWYDALYNIVLNAGRNYMEGLGQRVLKKGSKQNAVVKYRVFESKLRKQLKG